MSIAPRAGMRATSVLRVSASTSTTIARAGAIVRVDASGGAVTVTLPAATGTGRDVLVIKTDAGANAVTVQRAGSDALGGGTSHVLYAPRETVTLIDEAAAQWWVVA